MIYFTGDMHGEIDIEKISAKNWKESKSLTKDDYLIILGDFGFPFPDKEVKEDNQPSPHSTYVFVLYHKIYSLEHCRQIRHGEYF